MEGTRKRVDGMWAMVEAVGCGIVQPTRGWGGAVGRRLHTNTHQPGFLFSAVFRVKYWSSLVLFLVLVQVLVLDQNQDFLSFLPSLP